MGSKAFLFDLNGTIIDDMEFHVKAWSQLLNGELQANMDYEAVKAQMYGKNSELLDRVFGVGHFATDRVEELSMKKEQLYHQFYKPHMQLIDGLGDFLKKAYEADIPMGIGTAAITLNVDFILDNLDIRKYFGTIVSADDVTTSKPHPETFLKGAKQLKIAPENCIVFEDAPKGVEAAQNAGMKVVCILSALHKKEEFENYPNIVQFVHSYSEIDPATL
jgi:beta-phosphoglucomutase